MVVEGDHKVIAGLQAKVSNRANPKLELDVGKEEKSTGGISRKKRG